MQSVRKRRVFYFAGFDPRGSSAYHRLFCDESQKQAALSGVSLQVGQRKREGPLSTTWRAEREEGGSKVESTFEFLHWDDIARVHWHDGYAQLVRLAFKVYWYWLIASDFLSRRIPRVSTWHFITGLAPGVVLFVLPPLAVLAAWGGYTAGTALPAQSGWLSPALAAAGVAVVIAFGWWLERFFTLGWLLRTYAFVIAWSLGQVPELDERVTRFAERIASYVETSDDDEIIVVGHSVGANVAVSALDKALAINPGLCTQFKPVGFFTLGGSIPLQALMPWSRQIREELARVAAHGELPWVDVAELRDAASFPGNPLTVSGVMVNGKESQRPLVVPGAFDQVLTPGTLAWAQLNMFRMHFQYLSAGEIDTPNNYFAVTTDGKRFRERFPFDRA